MKYPKSIRQKLNLKFNYDEDNGTYEVGVYLDDLLYTTNKPNECPDTKVMYLGYQT